MKLDKKIENFITKSEQDLKKTFKEIENISLFNQSKVLNAFRFYNLSARHFNGSTGYGYNDDGRECLAKIYARVFGGENAIVSPNITCGSHALTIALFGLLRPNDTLLCVTGKPYDTLDETIFGVLGKDTGSLKDFNIKYEQVNLKNNELDYEIIKRKIVDLKPKVVYLQRSRGYEWRKPISIAELEKTIKLVKEISPGCFILVDNCYGEFVENREPCNVGADITVGSLIKNPGGGLAPTGGYIVGKSKAIEMISSRYTSPSLGVEVGSYEGGWRLFFQGLFLASSIVANALKGAYLLGDVMNRLGYDILPLSKEKAYDIIKSIKFNTKDELISFVQTIQTLSPVDSFVVPIPWDMPGYSEEVIMAAGTFVGGASIELSCDSPIKEPYIAYFQGGLTYEHVKLATIELAKKFIK